MIGVTIGCILLAAILSFLTGVGFVPLVILLMIIMTPIYYFFKWLFREKE